MNQDFVFRVMNLFDKYTVEGSLFWHTDEQDQSISFFVICSDMFYPAAADLEDITEENIALLEQAFEDASSAYKYGEDYGVDLFCCRVRGLSPHKYYLDDLHEELIPLFTSV